MPLIDLTDATFDEVIEKNQRLILDFWAEWCGPCQAFAPHFAAAAEANPDILFARINTDVESNLARQFEVRSIPTLITVRDATIVQAKVGSLTPKLLDGLILELRQT